MIYPHHTKARSLILGMNDFKYRVLKGGAMIKEEMNSNISTPFIFFAVGIFLGFIVVNLPVINFFQPILSVLLLYLALQKLRSENIYLHICWIIVVVMLVYYLFYVVFLSAPTLAETQMVNFIHFVYRVFYILLLIFFRQGFRRIGQTKWEQTDTRHTDYLSGLIFKTNQRLKYDMQKYSYLFKIKELYIYNILPVVLCFVILSIYCFYELS